VRVAGDCLQPLNAGKKKFKKKHFEDTKGCALRFDLHQTLEPVVDQYTEILKNIPYEYISFSISAGFNFRCNVPR
jgi:hypothetical protein